MSKTQRRITKFKNLKIREAVHIKLAEIARRDFRKICNVIEMAVECYEKSYGGEGKQ